MLTNKSVGANVLQMLHPDFRNVKNEVALAIMPFFHSLVVTLLPSLYTGIKLVTLPKFEPESFLSTTEKYTLFLVPPLVLFLAKHPLVGKFDITCVNDTLIGAAPVGKDLIKAASQRTQCKLFRQLYGLTETSPITHIMPRSLGMSKPDSIGHCMQSMKVKIVDLESGEALPPNKKGELWLHGPNVMKGYLNNPEATHKAITDDGWFKSGDLG